MVARLKDRGLDELATFKARALRQAALKRISKADADWLVERIDEISARVIRMTELPELEKEFM